MAVANGRRLESVEMCVEDVDGRERRLGSGVNARTIAYLSCAKFGERLGKILVIPPNPFFQNIELYLRPR